MALDVRLPALINPIEEPSRTDLEAGQLKLQQVRQQRDALIEQAKDRTAIQQAFQAHIGADGSPDFPNILKALSSRPTAYTQIQTAVTKMRKDAADQEKLDLENH